MDLKATKKVVMAALLLPGLVMGAEAVLLIKEAVGKLRVLEADKNYAYVTSDAGRLGSSTIPAEAHETVLHLSEPREASAGSLRQARSAVDRDFAQLAAELAAVDDKRPVLRSYGEKLRIAMDGINRYRIRVDYGNAVTEEIIGRYKPASDLSVDLVDVLRFEIADPVLSRRLHLFISLLKANESGLVANFYGIEYLRGRSLSATDLDTFVRAAAMKDESLHQLAVHLSGVSVKQLLDFEETPSGQWLQQTTREILAGTAQPSRPLLQRWARENEARVVLWQRGIAQMIGEIRQSGDTLAAAARHQLLVLVGAIGVLSLLLGLVIVLAIKGVALASRLLRERELLVEELRNAAQTDHLTGLYNRRGFDGMARVLLEAGSMQAVSVVIFDLDRFKQVNDIHGHQAGDVVLQRIGEIARSMFRSGDLLARHGGEEFLALLPDCHLESAAEVAERVREAIEGTEFALDNGTVLRVTASFGCASGEAPIGTTVIPELIRRADLALYTAKFAGRNRVALDGESDVLTAERRAVRQA
ncbi:MAG: GGDEF domain-containing protein [Hydrogenophaga sp.]|nr:GGDEF domain-containing protein [Hydrogenophaga sp.]